jgi:hypothetical protein
MTPEEYERRTMEAAARGEAGEICAVVEGADPAFWRRIAAIMRQAEAARQHPDSRACGPIRAARVPEADLGDAGIEAG